MLELCNDYRENLRRVDAALRVEENFDLIKKELVFGGHSFAMYYLDGFVNGGSIKPFCFKNCIIWLCVSKVLPSA